MPSRPGNDQTLPLAGVRVVEFAHMVMGPTCGMILGDLGADVIKVEPLAGDNTRRLTGAGVGFFCAFNRNKRSLAVDIKSEAGLTLVRRLVDTADVVTENFRPGAMDRLGLGYESVSRTNPRLVYCSLKGFLSGPYEHRTALDEVVQMMGGLAYMTGPPGRPLRAGASVNDIMGGMFAVIAILAALRQRGERGRGQRVQSALFETCVLLVTQHMAQFALTGTPAPPMPERLSAWGIYDVFDTRDREQVFVGVVTDTQWQVFCETFDRAQWLEDEALSSNSGRVAERDRLIPMVRRLFAQYPKHELMATCERIGLPFAPIARPEELYDDPHLDAAGGFHDVATPDGGCVRIPALPITLHGRRPPLWRDVPAIGADSRDLLDELGYTQQQIDELVAEGIIVVSGQGALQAQ